MSVEPPAHRAPIIGWDIGGAHVKASLVIDGRVRDVVQWPAPLWQGLSHLDTAIASTRARWPQFGTARHAVTMTAEMTDLFDHREAGVLALAAHLATALGDELRLYAGAAGWASAADAGPAWQSIASANWLATAQLVARRVPDAVLVDVGSTTTDLIPIDAGQPVPAGRSDADRLVSGELVYLGVVRTPLCGLARQIRFDDELANVMNELFATTADVFRLSGELDPAHDQYPPADGGGKDAAATRQRLARMIGRDAREADPAQWRIFAEHWRQAMLDEIGRNLARVSGGADPARPIIGAGCGAFLARALAQRLERPYFAFAELVEAEAQCAAWAGTCAPSVAVALLFAGEAA